MTKKILLLLMIIPLMLLGFSGKEKVLAYDFDEMNYDAVYFGSRFCSACIALENNGALTRLTQDGYRLVKYIYEEDQDFFDQLFRDFSFTYDAPLDYPILFFGDTYLLGSNQIIQGIDQSIVQETIDLQPLLPIVFAPPPPMEYSFSEIMILLGKTILLGLGDAFNICAIAMLLMFISFLSTTKKKKTIALICLIYITSIFISYVLIGLLLSTVFNFLAPFFHIFAWVIVVLATILMFLNLHDFIKVRQEKYHEVKNQLPKGAFKIAKKLMNKFSQQIENGSPSVYFTAFIVGVVVALIEFPCTGQVYVIWLEDITRNLSSSFLFYIFLGFYNLLFVSPLIVISYIAIKTQSINSVSNFMRERMDVIKLLNVFIFLLVILYYIFVIIL